MMNSSLHEMTTYINHVCEGDVSRLQYVDMKSQPSASRMLQDELEDAASDFVFALPDKNLSKSFGLYRGGAFTAPGVQDEDFAVDRDKAKWRFKGSRHECSNECKVKADEALRVNEMSKKADQDYDEGELEDEEEFHKPTPMMTPASSSTSKKRNSLGILLSSLKEKVYHCRCVDCQNERKAEGKPEPVEPIEIREIPLPDSLTKIHLPKKAGPGRPRKYPTVEDVFNMTKQQQQQLQQQKVGVDCQNERKAEGEPGSVKPIEVRDISLPGGLTSVQLPKKPGPGRPRKYPTFEGVFDMTKQQQQQPQQQQLQAKRGRGRPRLDAEVKRKRGRPRLYSKLKDESDFEREYKPAPQLLTNFYPDKSPALSRPSRRCKGKGLESLLKAVNEDEEDFEDVPLVNAKKIESTMTGVKRRPGRPRKIQPQVIDPPTSADYPQTEDLQTRLTSSTPPLNPATSLPAEASVTSTAQLRCSPSASSCRSASSSTFTEHLYPFSMVDDEPDEEVVHEHHLVTFQRHSGGIEAVEEKGENENTHRPNKVDDPVSRSRPQPQSSGPQSSWLVVSEIVWEMCHGAVNLAEQHDRGEEHENGKAEIDSREKGIELATATTTAATALTTSKGGISSMEKPDSSLSENQTTSVIDIREEKGTEIYAGKVILSEKKVRKETRVSSSTITMVDLTEQHDQGEEHEIGKAESDSREKGLELATTSTATATTPTTSKGGISSMEKPDSSLSENQRTSVIEVGEEKGTEIYAEKEKVNLKKVGKETAESSTASSYSSRPEIMSSEVEFQSTSSSETLQTSSSSSRTTPSGIKVQKPASSYSSLKRRLMEHASLAQVRLFRLDHRAEEYHQQQSIPIEKLARKSGFNLRPLSNLSPADETIRLVWAKKRKKMDGAGQINLVQPGKGGRRFNAMSKAKSAESFTKEDRIKSKEEKMVRRTRGTFSRSLTAAARSGDGDEDVEGTSHPTKGLNSTSSNCQVVSSTQSRRSRKEKKLSSTSSSCKSSTFEAVNADEKISPDKESVSAIKHSHTVSLEVGAKKRKMENKMRDHNGSIGTIISKPDSFKGHQTKSKENHRKEKKHSSISSSCKSSTIEAVNAAEKASLEEESVSAIKPSDVVSLEVGQKKRKMENKARDQRRTICTINSTPDSLKEDQIKSKAGEANALTLTTPSHVRLENGPLSPASITEPGNAPLGDADEKSSSEKESVSSINSPSAVAVGHKTRKKDNKIQERKVNSNTQNKVKKKKDNEGLSFSASQRTVLHSNNDDDKSSEKEEPVFPIKQMSPLGIGQKAPKITRKSTKNSAEIFNSKSAKSSLKRNEKENDKSSLIKSSLGASLDISEKEEEGINKSIEGKDLIKSSQDGKMVRITLTGLNSTTSKSFKESPSSSSSLEVGGQQTSPRNSSSRVRELVSSVKPTFHSNPAAKKIIRDIPKRSYKPAKDTKLMDEMMRISDDDLRNGSKNEKTGKGGKNLSTVSLKIETEEEPRRGKRMRKMAEEDENVEAEREKHKLKAGKGITKSKLINEMKKNSDDDRRNGSKNEKMGKGGKKLSTVSLKMEEWEELRRAKRIRKMAEEDENVEGDREKQELKSKKGITKSNLINETMKNSDDDRRNGSKDEKGEKGGKKLSTVSPEMEAEEEPRRRKSIRKMAAEEKNPEEENEKQKLKLEKMQQQQESSSSKDEGSIKEAQDEEERVKIGDDDVKLKIGKQKVGKVRIKLSEEDEKIGKRHFDNKSQKRHHHQHFGKVLENKRLKGSTTSSKGSSNNSSNNNNLEGGTCEISVNNEVVKDGGCSKETNDVEDEKSGQLVPKRNNKAEEAKAAHSCQKSHNGNDDKKNRKEGQDMRQANRRHNALPHWKEKLNEKHKIKKAPAAKKDANVVVNHDKSYFLSDEVTAFNDESCCSTVHLGEDNHTWLQRRQKEVDDQLLDLGDDDRLFFPPPPKLTPLQVGPPPPRPALPEDDCDTPEWNLPGWVGIPLFGGRNSYQMRRCKQKIDDECASVLSVITASSSKRRRKRC